MLVRKIYSTHFCVFAHKKVYNYLPKLINVHDHLVQVPNIQCE